METLHKGDNDDDDDNNNNNLILKILENCWCDTLA
jgi:hypothetical protein